MFRNICLIGLPYSGKSILGKRLALSKKVGFIETDKMIEYAYYNPLKNLINGLLKQEIMVIQIEIIVIFGLII